MTEKRKPTLCNRCQAPIRWVRSAASGKMMPISPEPTADGRVWLDVMGLAHVLRAGEALPEGIRRRWSAHYAVCPSPPGRSTGKGV